MNSMLKQARSWATTISLTVMFGLQLQRILFPSFVQYLRDSMGVGSLNLAPIALGVFGLSFLAALLRRIAGAKGALAIGAGGVALMRVVEQFSTSPALDLYLSAAGVALFVIFIPIALGTARASGTEGTTQFGIAFLLGVAADTAIHTAAGTLDLSWHTGFLPILIVIALALLLLASLRSSLAEVDPEAASDGNWGRTLTLIVIGPWLFLQMLVFQNVARTASLTGWSLPAAGTLLVLGNVLSVLAAGRVARSGLRTFGIAIGGGILLVIAVIIPTDTSILAAAVIVAGQVLAATLMMIVFVGLGREATRTGLAPSTVANGVGVVLLVLLAFIYYVSYDLALGFRSGVLFPVAAVLLALGAVAASRGQITYGQSQNDTNPVMAAALLLILPLGLWLTWGAPEFETPDPGNTNVRVMTYNLHMAFNTDGRNSIEDLAQVIENSGADVIALQEVSRGWVICGSLDMIEWLSHRLGMPYTYAPAADESFGNAILSRYPIVSAEYHPLPPDDLLMLRSYIEAEIDIGGGTFTMIATHYYHLDDGSEFRQEQSDKLVSVWNNGSLTVILGDLNATPDAPEMEILADAGLVDISAELGAPPTYTYYSADPDHQIDYIWLSPDWTGSDFVIPQSTASDHLPLVVTLTLP